MSDRKIFCVSCGLYLGVIRDAKLMKIIFFLCEKCKTNKLSVHKENHSGSDMPDFLKTLFK